MSAWIRSQKDATLTEPTTTPRRGLANAEQPISWVDVACVGAWCSPEQGCSQGSRCLLKWPSDHRVVYGSKHALFTKASRPISTNIVGFAMLTCEKRRGAEQFCPKTTRGFYPKVTFHRLTSRRMTDAYPSQRWTAAFRTAKYSSFSHLCPACANGTCGSSLHSSHSTLPWTEPTRAKESTTPKAPPPLTAAQRMPSKGLQRPKKAAPKVRNRAATPKSGVTTPRKERRKRNVAKAKPKNKREQRVRSDGDGPTCESGVFVRAN